MFISRKIFVALVCIIERYIVQQNFQKLCYTKLKDASSKKIDQHSMDSEAEQQLIKDLKILNGNLKKTSNLPIGRGGDGSVYLWELITNHSTLQVAVKSAQNTDRNWER